MSATISVLALDRFSDLPRYFPEPLTETDCREVFYAPEWFATLFAHGHTWTGALRLLVAQADEPSATLCLPMIAGTTLRSLSNYYASLYGPLGQRGAINSETCCALAEWLIRQEERWPLIDLHPLDIDSPFFGDMLAALQHAGYWADHYACFGNWYYPVNQRSFAEYLAERPSALRHTLERNRRKAGKAGALEIVIHREPGAALEEAIADFASIYAASWKGRESHPDFVVQLCRLAATQGWLRLGILRSQQVAVAAQIWLVYAGKANIFKLAYRPDLNHFSAGTLLTADMMRHVIEVDRVDEVDYLTGDDAYKRDWMTHRRERRGIVAFHPRTPRGLWLATRHYSGKLIKKIQCFFTN